jgi:hypothetical protein
MKERGVWAYPWDMEADPDAGRRMVDLGLTYVSLAVKYHAVRALAYLPSRPKITTHRSGGDFLDLATDIAEQNAKIGLATDAWTVCFHEDPPPEGQRMINCFGDEYPWASCPANPAAAVRIIGYIENVARKGVFRTLELEAFGFYGLAHGSEHDKVALTDPRQPVALSICCCPYCQTSLGVKPEHIHDLFVTTDGLATYLRDHVARRSEVVKKNLGVLRGSVGKSVCLRMAVSADPLRFGAECPISHVSDDLDELSLPVWTHNPQEIVEAIQFVASQSNLPMTAGFQTVPPFCPDPVAIPAIVGLIKAENPHGICAYHGGMMTPAARDSYAASLR